MNVPSTIWYQEGQVGQIIDDTDNSVVSPLIYREGAVTSTDTKPILDDMISGSKLLEIDTGKLFVYNAKGATDNDKWVEWCA